MGVFRRTFSIAALLAIVLALTVASPASAHTAFAESDPAAGSVVDAPVDRVTLVFTAPVTPVGDGFQLTDGDGDLHQPIREYTTDSETWIMEFDPPITDGLFEVRWSIRSLDSHLLSGSFRFTVDGSDPADGVVSSDRAASPASPAETLAPTPPTDSKAVGGNSTEAIDGNNAPIPASSRGTASPVEDGSTRSTGTNGTKLTSSSVGNEVDWGRATMSVLSRAETLGLAGRFLTISGTLIAIGALAFLLFLLRGTSGEGRLVITTIRRAALVVAVGAIIELGAQSVLEGGRLSSIVSPGALYAVMASPCGTALGFKLIGAFGLSGGNHFRRVQIGFRQDEVIRADMARYNVLAATPSGRVAGHPPADNTERIGSEVTPLLYSWLPSAGSSGAILGAIALISASLVDGHSFGGASSLLSIMATVAHVVAGSVWVGGIVVLSLLLRRRFRSQRRVEAADLAVRYSVMATVSLVAVGVAGVALTISSIESVSDLWTTGWGRFVLAKLALVAVAAMLGAANHFMVVPRLAAAAEDVSLGTLLRRVVSVEIAVLATVVAVTAQLVATAHP